MAEIRFNPLTGDWVMIASHRQNRPQMPKDWCPFCPGSGKVPSEYDVYCYDNDFPALSATPPSIDDVTSDFFKAMPSYGKCEVVLYSPKHTATLPDLTDEHLFKLTKLWQERFNILSQDEKVKYVFIFENRGEAVGVTMPHPHGQIYAYPFLPKKLQLEENNSKEYMDKTGSCLYCDMLKNETQDGRRIIYKNEFFTVFLPFFCEYPYGVYIMSNVHKQHIGQFNEKELFSLGVTIKQTAGMLDSLFGYTFPYMMCMHNAPVNSGSDEENFHFHIEFFPPMRSAEKIKFNASSETGAWAHCNPTAPEEKAEELRVAYRKYMSR
ncbi:MAG: galactose-1-phosphate uridylyltransferase [Oscillospiraceae bacterium]